MVFFAKKLSKLFFPFKITEGLSDDLEATASASSAAAADLSAQLDSAASLAAFCRNALI